MSTNAGGAAASNDGLGLQSDQAKLCRNCEHSRRHFVFGWEFATCEAPQNKRVNPVTGKQSYRYAKYCDVQRIGDVGDCAPVGRWFTPTRKPVWMKALGA